MLTGIVPGRLKKLNGDASLPEAGGHRIIFNLVNDSGEWNQDKFRESLAKRWPLSKLEYRRGYLSQRYFKLGLIQEINIRSDLTVVNAIVISEQKLNEEAVKSTLIKLAELAKYNGSSVHMNEDEHWENIAELINECVIGKGINVTLYGSE